MRKRRSSLAIDATVTKRARSSAPNDRQNSCQATSSGETPGTLLPSESEKSGNDFIVVDSDEGNDENWKPHLSLKQVVAGLSEIQRKDTKDYVEKTIRAKKYEAVCCKCFEYEHGVQQKCSCGHQLCNQCEKKIIKPEELDGRENATLKAPSRLRLLEDFEGVGQE